MAKYTLQCVGLDIPGEDFEYISFHSGASLLDADIVLFEPRFDYETDYPNPSYQGKPNLTDYSSVQNRDSLSHWNQQIGQAFKHGVTILVFLRKPEEVFAATGSTEFSGTGRSMKTIRHVGPIHSYSSLPVTFDSITLSKGKNIKLTQEGSSLLGAYWKALGSISHYEVYYDRSKSVPLMTTRKGEKTVASLLKGKKGNILLLPVLDFYRDDFMYYDEKKKQSFWTEDALKFGKALLGAVIELHKILKTGSERSPAPSWATSKDYQLQIEKIVEKEITQVNQQITQLRDKRVELEKKLDQQTLTKGLLYEKGKPLEAAVIEALQTLGFKAAGYCDDESEFDIIFESAEGRFLGEAEGKDSSAINIEKFQQLERNVQEDFAKDHVTEFAKGVLFGNPHRLTKPSKRTTLFTAKALSAAQRSGFALVHTAGLFPIVQYLKKKKDAPFARKVRQCFATSSGEIVKFPDIPVKGEKKSTEQKNSPDKK